MMLANTAGIIVGNLWGRKIPSKVFKWLSFCLFALFGILTLLQ
jgi:putative Ca2+/H+ antiporter (TMEM165/GDT1 family)